MPVAGQYVEHYDDVNGRFDDVKREIITKKQTAEHSYQT